LKIKRFEGSDLRHTLAGMITDQVVCNRIASQWTKDGLFDNSWCNLVGKWCIDYLKRFGEPPNGQLRARFEEWVETRKPDDVTIRLIEKFLTWLNQWYNELDKKPSSDYLLDCAGRYFNSVRLRKMIEVATDEIDRGEIDTAYGRLTGVNKVELGLGSYIKVAEDFDAWRESFDREKRKSLIPYPDAVDKFFSGALTREKLIAFMSPDKCGKSMIILDLAYRAIKEGNRVAYFECGDMGKNEVMLRLGQRASRQPLEAKTVFIPTKVSNDGRVRFRKESFPRGLTPGIAYRAFKKACRNKDVFRLSYHSNSSINVSGICSILKDWERENWVADVVVIDYADILAPPTGVRETLDQIDEMWKHLRRLSQDFHCLVVTATQSSAAAYSDKQKVLGRKHFSGRKTKLAHVNGMIGLNVSTEEKERGIIRMNWVVRRDAFYSETRCLVVASCFDIANPIVKAIY